MKKLYSDYAIKNYFYKLEVNSKHSKNCKIKSVIETKYANNDMEAIDLIKKWLIGWNPNIIFMSINIVSKTKNKKKNNKTIFEENIEFLKKHPKWKKFYINSLNIKKYKKVGITL